MVSTINQNEKFFKIFARKDFNNNKSEYLFVPQKIFPKSKVIDHIKKSQTDVSDKNNVTSFYVNRHEDDMRHVIDYLSGQTIVETKMNVIKEILENDFDISIISKASDTADGIMSKSKEKSSHDLYQKTKSNYILEQILFDGMTIEY
jgi:hypothetical protein